MPAAVRERVGDKFRQRPHEAFGVERGGRAVGTADSAGPSVLMASAARAHRAAQQLTELPAGARPLDFVRRKRDRDEEHADERAPGDHVLRSVRIALGQVAQASGSAYVEIGRAKLLCTVSGPLPDARAAHFSETGRLVCQVHFSAFSGLADATIEQQSRELPLIIHPAVEAAVQLQRFPKSLLEVHVQVLEQDGDMSGPAIMGASLALADAGIEMFDLVAACSVARAPVPAGNAGLLLDPSSAQLAGAAAGATLTVAMMPARGEVTQISQVGEWDMEQYMEAMELGLEACGQLHTLMRQALVSSVEASS